MSDQSFSPELAVSRLQIWLRIDAKAKPSVYRQVFASSEIASLSYWLEIVFSAGIATFGLVLSSPAVIIGAMLISPLMGPIMATGMALAIGDLYLGIKAVLNLTMSVTAAIGLSAFLAWLLPFHSTTAEILARTNPNLLDLGVALLSGLAGSVVVSRTAGAGGVTALPGVAIAVALMPPLCTMGFGLGSDFNLTIMAGAGLLFLTNLVAIVASAFLVFLAVGMNSTEVRAEVDGIRQDDALARMLLHSPAARMLSGGNQLRWRILMLLLLLGSIAVPLRTALMQVAAEAAVRGATQSALRGLVPANAVVSQQVRVNRDNVEIRIVSTQAIPAAKVTETRDTIMRRTGRVVDLTVDEVASRSELTDLLGRLTAPAPVRPKEQSLAEIQQQMMERVRPALADVWPADVDPVRDFNVIFDPDGITLNVRYEAPTNLGEIPQGMILRSLRAKLATPDLSLHLERLSPARQSIQKKRR